MARRKNSFDDKLARVHALSSCSVASAVPELTRFLADDSAYLVGEAARVVSKLELVELVPDLARAFETLLVAGASADRGCHAKVKIIEALISLDAHCWETYRKGLSYVQMEFAGVRPIDSAGVIRAMAAHALVRTNAPHAALDVAPLLFDETSEARIAAADALADTADPLTAGMLHLKVIAGDSDIDVLGACYRGMLSLEPRRYLPIVASALDAGVLTAALALGESRLPEALSVLKDALSGAEPNLEESIFLGISLLRSDLAQAYLFEVLEQAPEGRAVKVLEALALHRHDADLSAQVHKIVNRRKSRKLARVFSDKFGPGE